MNQSKKYGIKNPKWICFLKLLFAQTCQRTTMMWPQRLFVRLETSENIHEDEKKFEKFFSSTQKYFTCPASCEENENMAYQENTRWLVVSKWLEDFEKVFVFFGSKFKLVSSGLGLFLKSHGSSSPCQWFGWFFNMYMAGTDSCVTQLSPSIWFGVVKIFLIIF